MKTILIFSLICFTFCIWGPVEKAGRSDPDNICDAKFDPESSSDCVDLSLIGASLYPNRNAKYYDRCCFVRYQIYGNIFEVCRALTEEEYLDIVETKKNMEKYYDEMYREYYIEETITEGYYTKIYKIDCASSYIKFFSIASILLALLF